MDEQTAAIVIVAMVRLFALVSKLLREFFKHREQLIVSSAS